MEIASKAAEILPLQLPPKARPTRFSVKKLEGSILIFWTNQTDWDLELLHRHHHPINSPVRGLFSN
jgi:hypothetical protein